MSPLTEGAGSRADLAGFAYHFWNGAASGTIVLAVTGGRSMALAILYGIAIGVGFLEGYRRHR